MKILCILTTYNEAEYLPYKKKFCDYHDLDLYVIDNYSHDGTWEWLQDNKIPSHRFDTDGMFALEWLQEEILRTLLSLANKPDWVIYNGADLFPICLPSLNEAISKLDQSGFNLASIPYLAFFNTGEERIKDPFTTFNYFSFKPGFVMMHKYHESIIYHADDVKFGSIPNSVGTLDGIMINYGQTKSKEERDETYLRRKKAWDSGVTPKGHGSHYRDGHNSNWIWDSANLTDIRSSPYYKYIQHLKNICL